MTLIVAVLFRHPLVLTQDTSCGHINVSNETAGTRSLMTDNDDFYLDIANPATCNGTVASWKVCYHGPTRLGNKQYEVVYAIYRRVSGYDGDMLYCKVSDTFSTDIRTNSDNEMVPCVGSRCNRSRSATQKTNSVECDAEGFRCYNESLDSNSLVFIRTGDIIGACVNNPNGASSTERRLDIVGQVNYSERSLLRMTTNNCGHSKIKGKFPSEVWLSQLSPLNSTVLHLYADISKYNYYYAVCND